MTKVTQNIPSSAAHLGDHLLIELHDCDAVVLAQPPAIEAALVAAAQAMKATLISRHFHHFSPLGVSGVIIIAESHLTIHTWPEHRYAAVDIFTCGRLDFQAALKVLKDQLRSERTSTQLLQRGVGLRNRH